MLNEVNYSACFFKILIKKIKVYLKNISILLLTSIHDLLLIEKTMGDIGVCLEA